MAASSAYGCGKQRLKRCMQKIFRIAHTMIKRRAAQNRAFFTGSAFRLSMARDSLYAAAIAGCPDGVSAGQPSAAKNSGNSSAERRSSEISQFLKESGRRMAKSNR